MSENQRQSTDRVEKKLDMITVILLARSGLTEEEIADTLDISTKTIERMFHGQFRRIQSGQRASKKESSRGKRNSETNLQKV